MNGLLILCLLIIFVSVNFHEADATINSKRAPIITQHSFQTPFTVPNWIFQGSAYFRDHYIRLTPDRQSRIGGLWNAMPVDLDSWEAVVEFKIHGQGRTGADGLAFWYAKEKSLGNLFGIDPNFAGLGLVVDTYDNDGSGTHPRLMVLVSTGDMPYEHHANHDHEDAEGMERGGCAFPARQTGTTSLMRVVYSREEKRLIVEVDHNDSGIWKPCTILENLELPKGYFFGFTAATGQLADNHDLYSFYVNNLSGPDLPEIYNAEQYTLNGFQHEIEKRILGLQRLLQKVSEDSKKTTPTATPTLSPASGSSGTVTQELDNHVVQLQTLVSNVQKDLRTELTALRNKIEQLAAFPSTPTPSTPPPTPAPASSSSSSFLSFSIVSLLILILLVLVQFQYQTKRELDKKLF